LRSQHGIASYLDVIDDQIAGNGEDLVAYLKDRMSTCSNLIAVVSPTTKLSQWVPWEIGVASERDMPLAAYLSGISDVPEFLKRWPRLSSIAHVDAYAAAMKVGESTVLRKRASRIEETASLRA